MSQLVSSHSAPHLDSVGQTWHLPVAETRTTRQIIDTVYRPAGHRPRIQVAGRTTLRLLGVVKPECVSTCIPFTSSPTLGSSTTASSGLPSETRALRWTRRSPPRSRGFGRPTTFSRWGAGTNGHREVTVVQSPVVFLRQRADRVCG